MRGAPAKRLGSLLFVTGHYFSIGGTEGFIPTCAIAENEYRDILCLFSGDKELVYVRVAAFKKSNCRSLVDRLTRVGGLRI